MKQRLEKYSERFDNKDNELVEGVFNPETWGKRLVDDVAKEESQNLKNFKKLVSDEVSPAMKEFIKEKETLEEAAANYVENFAMSVKSAREIGFIDGAKWQQERSLCLTQDGRKSYLSKKTLEKCEVMLQDIKNTNWSRKYDFIY